MNIERLTTPWWSLRVGVGAAAFLAGLDKFFNLLADWLAYLSPVAAQILPLSPSSFMHVIGGVERARHAGERCDRPDQESARHPAGTARRIERPFDRDRRGVSFLRLGFGVGTTWGEAADACL